jgi:hypothetical protein
MKNQTLFLAHLLINRQVIFLLILLFSFNNLHAQECGTPDIHPQEAMNYPWFGNPDYLPSFMDSVRNVEGIPSQYAHIVPDIKWRIPIKFWIVTKGI